MKTRLDVLTVERGLAPSREQAKALIMAGQIFVNGQREDKAGTMVEDDCKLELHGKTLRYVSRGGLKLEKAFEVFPLHVEGCCCLDIGASTGGFTDCLLQNGAARVHAVDVGYGQLDYRLRNDPRVICREKTNIRYLTPQELGETVDFACSDVSFISLGLVFGPMNALMKEGAQAVCLIKPQFEAGREKVGKKGVVREASTHVEVIQKVLALAAQAGLCSLGLDFSPIRGPEGNIEYLLYLMKPPAGEVPEAPAFDEDAVRALVARSHESFSKEERSRT